MLSPYVLFWLVYIFLVIPVLAVPLYVTTYSILTFISKNTDHNFKTGFSAVGTSLGLLAFIFWFQFKYHGFIFLLLFTIGGGAYGALKNRHFFSPNVVSKEKPSRLKSTLRLFFILTGYCLCGILLWIIWSTILSYTFGISFENLIRL